MDVAIVWDWDWSAVNENTDLWVPRRLAPSVVDEVIVAGRHSTQWTALMHQAAGELHARGFTESHIAAALGALPVFPEVPLAFQEAARSGALQFVISDANSVYIDVMANNMGVHSHISRVVTNRAHYDPTGRLHIRPWTDPAEPHMCALCPVNLCKGRELDALGFAPPAVRRVLYVGDGRGDLCPCLRLGPGDVIAARAGEDYALLPLLQSTMHRTAVAASVRPWRDGPELLAIVRSFLAGRAPA